MAWSRFASAHLCAALASSCLVIACGDPGVDPGDDAGITFPTNDAAMSVDAARMAVDAARLGHDAARTAGCTSAIECDDGDPTTDDACVGGVCENTPSGCSADWDCSDFDACTQDRCVGGACVFSPIADCAGCHSDAECDDGDPSTMDVCDTFTRSCSNFPSNPFCSDASQCDDNNPCTGDQCNSGTCAWGSIGTCCFRDTDCDDFDDCTQDSCDVSAHACSNESIPGCGTSTCMDFDGDGHGSRFCFPTAGDDCDDTNAAVHPGATENCTNGIDDDCNGFVDATDPVCASMNTMCSGATTLALPGMAHGTIVSSGAFVTGTDCGTHLYYTFSVATTSDVTVGLHFDDIPSTTVTCPGCPPPTEPMHEIWHNLTVEGTCGDATTSVAALSGTGGCYVWGGPFGGSRDHTLQMRRLAAGTYTIDVQAREFFPNGFAEAIPFDLTLSATTSAGAVCDGGALTEGGSVHGTTMGGADAFGLDCSGTPFASPERVHTFDVTTRSRVRLVGTPTLADGVTYAPGMQLAIRSACDPDIAPIMCFDTGGYTCQPSVSLERILDPGSYFVEIQSKNGPTAYDLSLQTEPVGAACAGAPVISASGSFAGNTTGGTDHFRWNDACGGGTAPEAVYELDVAASSRVVLDLIASAHTPVLRILSGCGDTIVAGSEDDTHIDRTLAAGTYQVVVDGGTTTDVGSFVLNATILPM